MGDLMLLQERLNSFHPEALVTSSAATAVPRSVREPQIACTPGEAGAVVYNLIKANYLNLLDSDLLKQNAENCIRTNGVGSCGPRGFYGTIDIHLDLEAKIAEFMGMEETVLYSYGFSTIASAIPAYCRKGDVIFCDEKISFSTKEGMNAGRSTVVYFQHNDMADLETKLQQHNAALGATAGGGSKFLLVEGIYALTGNICPLPELMELRNKYRLRIFIDESVSFGVLGRHGRGVTEHFNVDRSDVDMIVGSLEGAIGSIGGFCVGASVIIEHQRLSGLGYCFSASLPPFLSSIAICAIDLMRETPELFKRLENVCTKMHAQLEDVEDLCVVSNPLSPIKVFKLNSKNEQLLTFHETCKANKLFLNLQLIDNSITFCVSADMDDAEIHSILSIIKLSLSICK